MTVLIELYTGAPRSRRTRSRTWCVTLSFLLLLCGCETDRLEAPVTAPGPIEPISGDPRLPGVEVVDEALETRLARALDARGPEHAPRTRHVRPDGSPRFTNRLIEESSPYLLQHAHNPVSWHPWSKAAFERAKRENKPVFVSIGYSTCHWCHVMERESFEDLEIASFLNRHFIAIKVDREERPDVDSTYMTAVNLLTGRGGWPMTLVLTPDKAPFFGGTYLPPRAGVRGARLGLIDVLEQALALYRDQPAKAVERAQGISQRVARALSVAPAPSVPSDRSIVTAVHELAAQYDPIEGGFGGAPKFPQPSRLALLLRYARRTGDPGATRMLTTSLDRMAAGGIYDHVGGGFHRYATDARWLVPHFEKMLYDNAQLAMVYLEAWQHTGADDYRRIVREVLDYVKREMTADEGGFYSATDADSLGPSGHDEEGWYFTWTRSELVDVLGEKDAALWSSAFGVADPGSFEGRNVLHRVKSDPELAAERGLSTEHVAKRIADARAALYDARRSRPPPHLDDKIIAAWNGLMISAFARAGWVLGDPEYVATASRAAKFVLGTMRDDRGELVRTYRNGDKSQTSFLDDHALLVRACLDLYETTAFAGWLRAALRLQAAQDARFIDRRAGGYFLSPKDGETLLIREKRSYDGALPSGNAISASNLLRLHDLTGEHRWRQRAERLFAALGSTVKRAPTTAPMLLAALDHYYDVPLEVAIVVPGSPAAGVPLARRIRRIFLPNKALLLMREREAKRQAAVVPWLQGKRAIRNEPTAYVCERGRCERPTSSPAVFAKQLDKRVPYPSFTEAPPSRLPVGDVPQ